jgi:hypothetical protein
MNDSVERIRKVNREAYFKMKSRAEFMCLNTSTWKDPGMTDIDKIVQDLKDTQWKMADEIERLRKYEQMVQFIANDYYELSYDKIKWQRNDWRKRCQKLIQEDFPDPPMVQSDEELTKDLDF